MHNYKNKYTEPIAQISNEPKQGRELNFKKIQNWINRKEIMILKFRQTMKLLMLKDH